MQARLKRSILLNIIALFFSAFCFAVDFATPVLYPVGEEPTSIAYGDFNGDGNIDLAVANLSSNDVSILLGNGDGTFQAAVSYPVGRQPTGITTTCDTTTGGQTNLAVINGEDNDVSILRGNPDGTFRNIGHFPTDGGKPRGIVSADFNGDGFCDLAIANVYGGTNKKGNLAVFFGNGDGTFGAHESYTTLGDEPNSVTTSDFDGVLGPDLAVTNFASQSITVFLNDGTGKFRLVNYPSLAFPIGLISGALGTLDTSPDILALSLDGGFLVLYGDGDGTFSHLKHYGLSRDGGPSGISLGFFNLDSIPDVAFVDSDNTVNLYIGEPDMQFAPPIRFSTCYSPGPVLALDVNHDGRDDLVMVCNTGLFGNVGVMLNTGE